MKTANYFLLVALFSVSMIACSVEKSAEAVLDVVPSQGSQGAEGFDHKIQGPVVEGKWEGQCVYDSYEKSYLKQMISFSGQNVSRVTSYYSDYKCAQLVNKAEYKGIFRWTQTTSYGGFETEYKFDLGSGSWSYTFEEILLENGKMYLSDFIIGWGSISKQNPLTKVVQ